jgi:predicted dehydrogenase
MIAVGRRGEHNLKQMSGENIVAICDVYEPFLKKAAEQFPKARKFDDFRKIYDHPELFDAVVVSTPEHTHAVATMPALELKKHVYCEKPLTYNIAECRAIRLAARKAGVVTQMGTQNHANDNFRRVIELIRADAIGPVREVHVWVNRAWGLQSPEEARKNNDIFSVQDRPSEGQPVPDGLSWNLWLGPAKERPFHEAYWPGPRWYRWWDFGNGTMSDLGSHWNDLPFWAMELDAPLSIEAQGPPPHPEIAPASMSATYEYGPRGKMPALKLVWHQGTSKPELWRKGEIPKWNDGILFIGDKGMILANYGKHTLLPEDKYADYKRPDPSIPSSPGHHQEWIQACKTGGPTGSNFEYAGKLTEANHLGNLAFRVGRKITWDAENMTCPGAPEADPFIHRKYREGWSLS